MSRHGLSIQVQITFSQWNSTELTLLWRQTGKGKAEGEELRQMTEIVSGIGKSLGSAHGVKVTYSPPLLADNLFEPIDPSGPGVESMEIERDGD
jgi:hypothetical protein